ncbi:hypothetical protein, partial [Anaerovibrio lipolyticus]|uniref:glucosamine inositolphosphorylceramide transferase family protein n=1 Tax=Anaerovibrio lipolyticus TaxID=82374 RepID=UPI0023F070D8
MIIGLDKILRKDAYGVAIRKANTNDPFFIKYPTVSEWWADPFVCHHDGRDYCFVELKSSYRLHGEIAVATIEDGIIGNFTVVISEPFHMSFPNIFKYDNQWYMLPETNYCNQVRLYKAVKFPYEWKLDKILCNDVRLVDHALFPQKTGFYVLSNDIVNLEQAYNRFFVLDMREKTFIEFFPEGYWSNIRPGGNFYEKDNRWYHVLQDGVLAYGDYLHVYEVDEFSKKIFKEHETKTIRVSDLEYANSNGRLKHIHTYNCNEFYEVIDLRYSKIYPNRLLIHWYHEYLKHIKHNW